MAGTGSSSSPGLLPTPDAALALGGHTHRGGARSDEPLLPGVALALLRTPTAQLAVNGGSQHPEKRKAGGHGPTLADEVEHLLPTPVTDPASGNGHARDLGGEVSLLPTPDATHGRKTSRTGPLLPGAVALLPTPVVNDMGEGKTLEHWDEWTAGLKARHGNGNGHGDSLAIAAQRLLPTPVTTDAHGTRNSTSGRQAGSQHHAGDTLGDVVHRGDLLPTPRATDGAKGGPNQRGSGGDVMLPAAVQPSRWGAYAASVERWEEVSGRAAPSATEQDWDRWHRARRRRFASRKPVGHRGSLRPFWEGPTPRLSAPFVEWMMGLPAGWVTDVPDVNRNGQLKALGNGVVPQQATIAVAAILPGLPEHVLDALRGSER